MVVGALLVSSGALGTLLGFEGPGDEVHVEGEALFDEAVYEGEIEFSASDAVHSENGRYHAAVNADRVRLTLYSFEMDEATVFVKKAGLALSSRTEVEREVFDFRDATIRLEGDPTGSFHLWPNDTAPDTRFTLELSERYQPPISASPTGSVFYSDDGAYYRNVEGPAFALGHLTSKRHSAQLGYSEFEQLRATGGLRAVASNGTISVDYADGSEEFELSTDPGEGKTIGGDQAWAQLSTDAEGTYAVLDIPQQERASLVTDVATDEAFFLASDLSVRLNGTIGFEASRGQLSSEDTNRSLRNSSIEALGNFTLDLAPVGEEDGSGGVQKGFRVPPELLDDPDVDAQFEGEAEEVSVDGETLFASSSGIPEEVSLWGRILGLLLFAWTAGRKLLFFALGLFVGDPLDNDRRRRIYDLVHTRGMAYLSEIQETTDIPLGSVSYHLRILEEENLLTKVKRKGYVVYYPHSLDLSPDEMERLALLANGTRRKVAETIVDAGTTSQERLSEELDKDQSWISRVLSELEEADLVRREGDWRIRYAPSSLLRRWSSAR